MVRVQTSDQISPPYCSPVLLIPPQFLANVQGEILTAHQICEDFYPYHKCWVVRGSTKRKIQQSESCTVKKTYIYYLSFPKQIFSCSPISWFLSLCLLSHFPFPNISIVFWPVSRISISQSQDHLCEHICIFNFICAHKYLCTKKYINKK